MFGYHRNPYTGVCFRLVQQRQSWYAAKAIYEDAGEFLLSFTTLNEARWFRSLQLNQGGNVCTSVCNIEGVMVDLSVSYTRKIQLFHFHDAGRDIYYFLFSWME